MASFTRSIRNAAGSATTSRRSLSTSSASTAASRKREWQLRENLPDRELVFDEEDFNESWREEIRLTCAARLADAEVQGGPPYATVLRLRSESPKELRSEGLAQLLSEHLKKAVTAATARQMLHRAREKYAELLVEEVAGTVGDPTSDQLQAELIQLGLHEYCRAALERRVQKT